MSTRSVQSLHITTWTMVRFFIIVLAILTIYWIADILTALFFAIIVASALEPAVLWLRERGIPRILSVMIIYLMLAALFSFFIYLVLPLLIEDLRSVSFSFPEIQQRIITEIERAGKIPLLSFIDGGLKDLVDIPANYAEKISGGVLGLISVFFGGILSFILIVVFSFYLATQEKGIENFLRFITPVAQESYVIDLWMRSQKKLGRWLRTQVLLGALVGVLIFIGLIVMGVKNALLFAVLAAIFEIIPVVGPVLAAIPPTLATFFSSPTLGILVVLLFTVVQQLESHVIIPVVMKRAVGLSPLVVVLALLIGAKIGGIFGILLAVPITVILVEFVGDWDKKKRELLPE